MSKPFPDNRFEPSPHTNSFENRSNSHFEKSVGLDPWRTLATLAGFPIEQLRPAEVEILDMTERVLIRGKGWGKKDELKNIRGDIPLSPRKLSKKGKKLSVRTYQRAIRQLKMLGILNPMGIGADQVQSYTPSWWLDSPAETREMWAQAKSILSCYEDSLARRRAKDALSTDMSRTNVARPVPRKTTTTPNNHSQLPSKPVRQMP